MKTTGKMPALRLQQSFAFVAHYVETWNWFLNFRPFQFLHHHPERRWMLYPLYPLAWMASVWYLIGAKPFNLVDTFTVSDGHGGVVKGHTLLVRNFAWHFLLANYFPLIKQRIMKAVLYAQDTLHVHVVGLGALIKAEWLTAGGLDIAKDERVDRARMRVVHGDTATAWFVAMEVERLCEALNCERQLAVIGPTSKIGRAVMLYLIRKGYSFLAYTDSAERFAAIRAEVPANLRSHLHRVTSLAELNKCGFWLIGKAKPSGKTLARYMPRGAVAINFSVPDPLTGRYLKKRPDIRHFDGGLATIPTSCTMRFGMRLPLSPSLHGTGITGSMYACWSGTLIHTLLGWREHEVGEVKLDELAQVGDEAVRLGITLPRPTSHLRPIRGAKP